jgi:hypothetical protein
MIKLKGDNYKSTPVSLLQNLRREIKSKQFLGERETGGGGISMYLTYSEYLETEL